jgi:hypothetical protein
MRNFMPLVVAAETEHAPAARVAEIAAEWAAERRH